MDTGIGRWGAAAGLAALAAAWSCSPAPREGAPAGGTYRGAWLSPPLAKPDFTLTTTAGEPYDFRRETEGAVTLLFFGYTHCPDVCPVHMANIAAVLAKMGPSEARRIKVVFVTTDPERDTPDRLRRWLDSFDPRFIGLTGSPDALDRAQRSLGLRPAFKEGGGEDYAVGHAASVFAFTRDNVAHLVYPFGIRQVDWANDLPRLVRETWRAQ